MAVKFRVIGCAVMDSRNRRRILARVDLWVLCQRRAATDTRCDCLRGSAVGRLANVGRLVNFVSTLEEAGKDRASARGATRCGDRDYLLPVLRSHLGWR